MSVRTALLPVYVDWINAPPPWRVGEPRSGIPIENDDIVDADRTGTPCDRIRQLSGSGRSIKAIDR